MSRQKNLKIADLEVNNGQIEGLPKNPRFIKDNRFKALVKSIEDAPEMLDYRTLLVVPHDKKYVIVAGNMRFRACKELGYKELPCYVLPEETPAEKLREYAMKDNQGYGDNDWDLIANEWDSDELKEWGIETPADWGGENISPDDYGEDFNLPDGEKSNIETVSLMMSKEQAEVVKNAIKDAQNIEEYKYLETFGNENKSGNAVYLIVSQWADARK